MEKIIAVSACLLGHHCKYNGEHNFDINVVERVKGFEVIPICPEVLGGMSTPRISAEIMPGKNEVFNSAGQDVTALFERGAKLTLELLKKNSCVKVILKDGSPSCGYSMIYDGTFSGTKISGEGITCKYLKANGIEIIDLSQEGQL